MPAQRRFEGSTLAAVLAEVQKEVGADAKIVSAQKVRSGGFGGFFQRERFEVVVDLDPVLDAPKSGAAEPVAYTPPPVSEVKPSSLLDLAEAINKTERPPALERPGTGEPPAMRSDTSPKPISTETDSFADILSRVAFQADMQSQSPAAKPLIPDRPAIFDLPPPGFEADPDAEVEIQPQPKRKRKPKPKPKPEELPAVEFGPPEPDPAPAPLTAGLAELKPEPDVQFVPVAEPAAVITEMPELLVEPSPVRTRITDSPLANLGLPAEYIPMGVETSKLHSALVTALAELPKAPQVHPSKGTIVAVVGERNEAIAFAGDLCERWGRPAEDVVLASQTFRGKGPSTIVRTVRTAEDSRRSWSRRPHPTIVAVDSHPGSGDTTWAEHVLTAFEPITTYGVADATRKSEDIAAWAKALGGIDALAVNHMAETVSPASVIATEIAVDRIDGRKASPAYWAMLLVDRLNAL